MNRITVLGVGCGASQWAGYVIAFGAAIFREVGDAVVAASETSEGLPLILVLIVLAVDVAAFGVAMRLALASGTQGGSRA